MAKILYKIIIASLPLSLLASCGDNNPMALEEYPMTRHLSSCSNLEGYDFALCIGEADKVNERNMMICYLAEHGDVRAQQLLRQNGFDEEIEKCETGMYK